MSWVALSDGRRALRRPRNGPDAPALLACGSLVVEVLFQAADMAPQVALRMRRCHDWRRHFEVTLHSDGSVLVEHRQGPVASYASLRMTRPAQDDTLRITYSWDAPMRAGLLTVENLDTGACDQAAFDDPRPMPADDVDALISGGEDVRVDPTVAVIAISDRIEPVGLEPGIAFGAIVDTATGARRIETLQPGDLVVTEGRGYARVRQVLRRELPALGRFRPVALRAPFFGLRQDLEVGQNHRLLIRGADAEYLFGTDGVLVEARHLARTPAAMRPRPFPTVNCAQVVLDAHDCLMVAGTWAESLFLGDRGREQARLSAAALADCDPGDLPRHTRAASPLLEAYEAMVLVSALSA